MNSPITILNFNTDGLMPKITEIFALIAQIQPTVVILTDTRSNFRRIRLPGYELTGDQPQNREGGVLIAIRCGTRWREVSPPVAIRDPNIHHKTVQILLDKPTTIIALYRRPRSSLQDFSLLLNECSKKSNYWIVGDLNARHWTWHNTQSNKAGRIILKTPYTVVYPKTHTFRHRANAAYKSTVDLMLTRQPHRVVDCVALDFMTSDHRPVLYQIDGKIPTPLPTKYNYVNADWKLYKEQVHQELSAVPILRTKSEIDAYVEFFTATVRKAADTAIPKFRPLPPALRPPPDHILELIALRNKWKNKWYRTRDNEVKVVVNSLTTQIRNLIKQWRTSLWHEQLRGTHGDHKKFWRLLKTSTRKRGNTILHDGDKLLTPEEQARKFSCYYDALIKRRTGIPEEIPIEEIGNNYMFVSPKQLKAILRRTRGNKAPGHDGIQTILLKQLPRKGITQLANLYNSCLRLRYFPEAWKQAVLFPLLKPAKNGTEPADYRPISLLPHLGKVFEKIILNFLKTYCSETAIIPPEQTGFQAGLSPDHHLAKLHAEVSHNTAKNEVTAMISIDCTEAFDSVSHGILCKTLQDHEFPEQLFTLLRSFLNQRSLRVRVDEALSDAVPLTCGVPQGSVLSPVLFSVYTAETVGAKYKKATVAAYADDIAIYSSSLNAERALRQAEEACNQIKRKLEGLNITVNPKKTDCIIFSFQKNKRRLPKVCRIAGIKNRLSNNIVYLGVTLDRHLTLFRHCQQKVRMVKTKSYRLNHLLTSPNLSLRLKLIIYKSILRPALLNGAPMLSNISATTAKKLQQFQNSVLRRIVRHTSLQRTKTDLLHTTLGLPTVTEFISRRHIKFFDSLKYTTNPLFRTLTPTGRPQRWQTYINSLRLD